VSQDAARPPAATGPGRSTADVRTSGRAVVAGGVCFGFGLGGLVDGIVLHQVLGWHNLVSTRVPPEDLAALERNLFWDGVFHLATTAVLVVGALLLWWGWERLGRVTADLTGLGGLVLLGWGAFHAVDQLLFHLALDLHHIRQDATDPAIYDWAFFAIGVILAGVGAVLVRRGRIGTGSDDRELT
jgi:uncharacterized membrane protein